MVVCHQHLHVKYPAGWSNDNVQVGFRGNYNIKLLTFISYNLCLWVNNNTFTRINYNFNRLVVNN